MNATAPRPALAAQVLAHLQPDIVLLSGLPHDHDLHLFRAFQRLLADKGLDLPFLHAARGNSGLATGLDLNGDGRIGTADDAQGFGAYPGEDSMLLLSRFPVDLAQSRDFSPYRWADLPGNRMPAQLPENAQQLQRLSSTSHWDIALDMGQGRSLHLLAWQAGPPVFGGGQGQRNRARNHDETAFWLAYLDNALPYAPPLGPFVLMGGTNLDPVDGDGDSAALRALLSHPALQDPRPASEGAPASARGHAPSAAHAGPHALDTVEWPQPDGPGNLRVSYILPSRGLTVRDAGVFWPAPDDPNAALLGNDATRPSRHRPVWVDLSLN